MRRPEATLFFVDPANACHGTLGSLIQWSSPLQELRPAFDARERAPHILRHHRQEIPLEPFEVLPFRDVTQRRGANDDGTPALVRLSIDRYFKLHT